MYTAKPDNLAKWDYLGPLISVPTNFTLNKDWSGAGGANFEVSNAFSMVEKKADGGDGQTVHNFALVGIEGGHGNTSESIWYEADIKLEKDGSPRYDITAAGISDWADGYAINGFYDPVKDRRIFYAWVKEIIGYGGPAVGYNGQLSLPREVYVQVHSNVLTNRTVFNEQKGPWLLSSSSKTSEVSKLTTLGIRPISEINVLRHGAKHRKIAAKINSQSAKKTLKISDSTNFELSINMTIPAGTKAGVQFRASRDGREVTTLIYDPSTETLTLDRRNSSLIPQFIKTPGAKEIYEAKHFLLNYSDKASEQLELRIFVDESLVEVYANSRTVLSTHVYPALLSSTEVRFVVEGSGEVEATGKIWSGLQNAWPQRPTNTSTHLI